jgi:hypothetical protein
MVHTLMLFLNKVRYTTEFIHRIKEVIISRIRNVRKIILGIIVMKDNNLL